MCGTHTLPTQLLGTLPTQGPCDEEAGEGEEDRAAKEGGGASTVQGHEHRTAKADAIGQGGDSGVSAVAQAATLGGGIEQNDGEAEHAVVEEQGAEPFKPFVPPPRPRAGSSPAQPKAQPKSCTGETASQDTPASTQSVPMRELRDDDDVGGVGCAEAQQVDEQVAGDSVEQEAEESHSERWGHEPAQEDDGQEEKEHDFQQEGLQAKQQKMQEEQQDERGQCASNAGGDVTDNAAGEYERDVDNDCELELGFGVGVGVGVDGSENNDCGSDGSEVLYFDVDPEDPHANAGIVTNRTYGIPTAQQQQQQQRQQQQHARRRRRRGHRGVRGHEKRREGPREHAKVGDVSNLNMSVDPHDEFEFILSQPSLSPKRRQVCAQF